MIVRVLIIGMLFASQCFGEPEHVFNQGVNTAIEGMRNLVTNVRERVSCNGYYQLNPVEPNPKGVRISLHPVNIVTETEDQEEPRLSELASMANPQKQERKDGKVYYHGCVVTLDNGALVPLFGEWRMVWSPLDYVALERSKVIPGKLLNPQMGDRQYYVYALSGDPAKLQVLPLGRTNRCQIAKATPTQSRSGLNGV